MTAWCGFNSFPNNGGNTYAVGINDSGTICGNCTNSLSGWVAVWKAATHTPFAAWQVCGAV
ncbi:MAG: hypothetical protein NTV46_04520 [Verrucomicrobia bacterium]|nr:hypothetical protein [Verrucomicrobiota bacterium]